MTINLGSRIKELRKLNNMTQEKLAEKLNVSSQAVSKWENELAFPDITTIPIIANIFEVSIDSLMGYDKSKRIEEIQMIINDSKKYFWNDIVECENILCNALTTYPDDPMLLRELLSLYECHMRTNNRFEYSDKAQTVAFKLIAESDDMFIICSAKNDLASIYIMQNRYDDAKTLIQTLPYMFPYMLNDRMRTSSYLLRGDDKLTEAKLWKVIEVQELFIACSAEGEAYYEIGDYKNALKAFRECKDVIERFIDSENSGCAAYLIDGAYTNHMTCYLGIAGCNFKLGNNEECAKAIANANEILSNIGNETLVLEFKKYYIKYGLEAFRQFE